FLLFSSLLISPLFPYTTLFRSYVKSNQHLKRSLVRATRSTKLLSPDKIIECGRARSCPKCNSSHFFGHGRASKTVIDLRFMHHRSEEHTSELQSRGHLVCRLLL